MSGTLTEEIRERHNLGLRIIDAKTGRIAGKMEKNAALHNLHLTDKMSEYIDAYLDRPYCYEEHFTSFDISVQMFAQGVRNEELSEIMVGLPEPYVEQAIVNYMSAMEVITLKDKDPEKCDYCGQMRYSIARRVSNLAENCFNGINWLVKDYYADRSKYVHAGTLLSSNNYVGRSMPLMSVKKGSSSGMIIQVSRVPDLLKERVKACIEWHEYNK